MYRGGQKLLGINNRTRKLNLQDLLNFLKQEKIEPHQVKLPKEINLDVRRRSRKKK
jgi:hypothetical protein